VSPGHPTGTPKTGPKPGGLVWPGFKNVSVWRSCVGKVQRMLSPVWTQSSFGKKARACLPRPGVSPPTAACQSWAWAVVVATPAISIATTANNSTGFDFNAFFIFSPLLFLQREVPTTFEPGSCEPPCVFLPNGPTRLIQECRIGNGAAEVLGKLWRFDTDL